MRKIAITLLLTFCALANSIFAQNLTQTVKGRIIDKDSETALPFVNVIVLDIEPQIGTTTDDDGYFVLENVPVGRIKMACSFIGYKPVVLVNQQVLSGKELFLNIAMTENITKLEEVVVKGKKGKDKANNEMAVISARTFTVEETERYAGSNGDLARMAQNYAGVSSAGDTRNDIVIRGNAPSGLLWRLEGVTIPSPNHFASLGSSGGSVSILSHNTLANSDFMTGAWPAEYSNSVSGVFDLKLRNGNSDKREHYGEVSFNGLQFGTEGPLKLGKHASYNVNYRYSTLAVLDALGMNFVGITPEYQDVTFKLNMPTSTAGHFMLAGFGGVSKIDFMEKADFDNLGNSNADRRIQPGSKVGALLFSHQYFFNDNSSLSSHVAVSGTAGSTRLDSVFSDRDDKLFYGDKVNDHSYNFGMKYKNKFNAKNKLSAGFEISSFGINYIDSVAVDNIYRKMLDTKEDGLMLYQSNIQWMHRFSDKLSLYTGLAGMYFGYNGSYSIDPRASIKWDITERNSWKLGYGHHSQLQPIYTYFSETRLENGQYIQTNNNMTMTKSHHFVLANDILLSKDLRLKIETYYQQLYDIPVEQTPSDFSMSNYGADFHQDRIDSLVNEGTGKNYGIELTLEKFFNNNYYFLITGSLYESKYKTLDNVKRNTLFNGNYSVNVLGGYEYLFKNSNTFSLNLRFVSMGGKRYRVIDEQETIMNGNEVYIELESYKNRLPAYARIDLKVSYKINKPRISHEIALDIQNLANFQNIYERKWDFETNSMAETYQTGFYPNILYRIYF